MNQEALVPGLKFVRRHAITAKENEVLIKILEKPCSADQLATEMGKHITTIYHLVHLLKLKQLVSIKNQDEKGSNVFQFNEIILD
jgi:predicted transcriptional regulator